MLIVLAAMTFAACEKDKPTIMAYGMEHEVINVRDLTLWLESKYVYIKPWYSPDKEVQCFAGSDEKTGKKNRFNFRTKWAEVGDCRLSGQRIW